MTVADARALRNDVYLVLGEVLRDANGDYLMRSTPRQSTFRRLLRALPRFDEPGTEEHLASLEIVTSWVLATMQRRGQERWLTEDEQVVATAARRLWDALGHFVSPEARHAATAPRRPRFVIPGPF
jgi:hypothetical protein